MKNAAFILFFGIILLGTACGEDNFDRIDRHDESFIIEPGHGLDYYTRDTELSLEIAQDTEIPVFINKKKSTYEKALEAFEDGKAKGSWISVKVQPGWKFYKEDGLWKLKKK